MSWVLRNPTAALGILGVNAFVMLWASLSMYYARFGSSPEEVGLDYARVLTSRSGVIAWAIVVVLVLVTLAIRRSCNERQSDVEYFESQLADAVAEREKAAEGPAREELRTREVSLQGHLDSVSAAIRRRYVVLGIVLLAGLVAYPAYLLCAAASADTSPRRASVFDPFQGSAERARVRWLMSPSPPRGVPRTRAIVSWDFAYPGGVQPRFLLLGEHDGEYVLFDRVRRVSIRLPLSLVTVEIDP